MAMQLYEFTGIVHRSIVIAATTEAAARSELDSLGEGFCANSDILEITDLGLLDVRSPKSPDLEDEAHIVADVDTTTPPASDGAAQRGENESEARHADEK